MSGSAYNHVMLRCFKYLVAITTFVSLIALSFPSPSQAESVAVPEFAGTPYDLVNAVNALRASNGLSAYSVNSILMFTAQNQADYIAVTGNVSHTGAGGSGVTDRLLAAGYPLAGDLSLGGFRSENIIGGIENMSAQAAVNAWTGDAPHLNTMLSPNLSEIGAGAAVIDGRVYYVIDAALPTASGVPQTGAAAVGGGSAIPGAGAVIYPVVVSTPNADGDVIHEVKAGQSLWQIAIAYEVKIDDIKGLNNLFDNNIYPGNTLLIKKDTALPTLSPTVSPVESLTPVTLPSPTITSTSATEVVQPVNTFIPLPVSTSGPTNNNRIMGSVIGILALALLGGGIFTWLGNTKSE